MHPETATETFDNLVLFFQKFDQSEELRKRLYGMDKVEKDFHLKIYEFAERIELKTDAQDAVTIAAQLHRDLNAAREVWASSIKLKEQLDEKKQDIKTVNLTIRHTQKKIIELKKKAGVETDEALIKAAEQSDNKRALLKNIETLEQ